MVRNFIAEQTIAPLQITCFHCTLATTRGEMVQFVNSMLRLV
jgi:hypothetical protein